MLRSFLSLRILLSLPLLVFLTGCDEGDDDDDCATEDDCGEDDDTSADDDTADDDAVDDDTAPAWTGTVTGEVRDLLGAPLANLPVTLCLKVCLFTSSDANGEFLFDNVPPGTHKFDAVGPFVEDGSTSWSNVLIPVVVGENEAVTIPGSIYVPELGAPQSVSGVGPVTLGGDLTLDVDPAILDFPSYVESPWLAGLRLEPHNWPPFGLSEVTFLGVWALAPYDTDLPEEGPFIPVHIEDAFGLPPLAEVEFWVFNYDDGGMVSVATGAVREDGSGVDTGPGEGLTRITWVAVSAL